MKTVLYVLTHDALGNRNWTSALLLVFAALFIIRVAVFILGVVL